MKTPRLLLVEDDPQDEKLTLRALRNINVGNAVDVVHDGAAALDYLFCEKTYASRSPCKAPAIVLLDIKLPKLNGLEVLERVRASPRTRSQPVVILTSSDEERDLIASYELGVNSYVRKPLDPREFSQAVAQLGLYWLVLNELPGKST